MIYFDLIFSIYLIIFIMSLSLFESDCSLEFTELPKLQIRDVVGSTFIFCEQNYIDYYDEQCTKGKYPLLISKGRLLLYYIFI